MLQFGANEWINPEEKLEPKNVQECVLTPCWACCGGANKDLTDGGGKVCWLIVGPSYLANRLALPPVDRLTKH